MKTTSDWLVEGIHKALLSNPTEILGIHLEFVCFIRKRSRVTTNFLQQ